MVRVTEWTPVSVTCVLSVYLLTVSSLSNDKGRFLSIEFPFLHDLIRVDKVPI